MRQDEPLYDVIFSKTKSKVTMLSDNKIYLDEKSGYKDINEFLHSRVGAERPTTAYKRSLLGLPNDLIGILKITKGVKDEDFIWLKFDGDNTTWKDVSKGFAWLMEQNQMREN
ncbi:hypothetical protein ACFQ4L_06435 [Lapidilactobacillus mulanensis]|uniref:Uncharacterized protein n=1 Tax=Lapidilactobacillus mulanensis TaxID=2485999 RepID=A0ABW4DM18_9LACO|nr:hypothetical protein [Lapidilactobacillus mulanensis]